jgi:hypothetical protein
MLFKRYLCEKIQGSGDERCDGQVPQKGGKDAVLFNFCGDDRSDANANSGT